MENAGNALSTINSYMAAKRPKTEDSCLLTFAKHLANELDAIRSDRLRKQVQGQVLQLVLEAQLSEFADDD